MYYDTLKQRESSNRQFFLMNRLSYWLWGTEQVSSSFPCKFHLLFLVVVVVVVDMVRVVPEVHVVWGAGRCDEGAGRAGAGGRGGHARAAPAQARGPRTTPPRLPRLALIRAASAAPRARDARHFSPARTSARPLPRACPTQWCYQTPLLCAIGSVVNECHSICSPSVDCAFVRGYRGFCVPVDVGCVKISGEWERRAVVRPRPVWPHYFRNTYAAIRSTALERSKHYNKNI